MQRTQVRLCGKYFWPVLAFFFLSVSAYANSPFSSVNPGWIDADVRVTRVQIRNGSTLFFARVEGSDRVLWRSDESITTRIDLPYDEIGSVYRIFGTTEKYLYFETLKIVSEDFGERRVRWDVWRASVDGDFSDIKSLTRGILRPRPLFKDRRAIRDAFFREDRFYINVEQYVGERLVWRLMRIDDSSDSFSVVGRGGQVLAAMGRDLYLLGGDRSPSRRVSVSVSKWDDPLPKSIVTFPGQMSHPTFGREDPIRRPPNAPWQAWTHTASTDNLLFFVALNTVTKRCQLWRTDGTLRGTFLLANLGKTNRQSDGFLCPMQISAGSNSLYFTKGSNGVELWRSDGTRSGTGKIRSFNHTRYSIGDFHFLGVVDERLIFATSEPNSSSLIWSNDGTTQGTDRFIRTPSRVLNYGFSDGIGNGRVVGAENQFLLFTDDNHAYLYDGVTQRVQKILDDVVHSGYFLPYTPLIASDEGVFGMQEESIFAGARRLVRYDLGTGETTVRYRFSGG